MKKLLYTTFFVSFSFLLSSQELYPPNAWFSDTSVTPCPFDSSENVKIWDDWLIYQTLDGTWNGEIDSSKCFVVTDIDFSNGIELNQIDETKPLFIRSAVHENPKNYYTDWLYNLGFNGRMSTDLILNLSDTCANGLCSGIIAEIEIPDSTGNELAARTYYDAFEVNTWGGNNNINGSFCVATEKFEFNNLKEFVLKFTFETQNLDNHHLYNFDLIFEELWDFEEVTEIIVFNQNGNGEYDYHFWNQFWGPVLGKFTNEGYPSNDNFSFIEARPEPNSTEQETINIYSELETNIIFQPFTGIRGALIEGSDSIRHITNFINDGGDICLNVIIDLVFGNNATYIHKAGNLDFHGRTACMAFLDGSAIEVADNATLYYGNGGEGILNLRPGSTMRIGENAEMIIDNKLWMFGKPKEGQPSQIFMELNPNSKLTFGENAQVLNEYARSPDTKLNIYMNGGILDDSKLDAASRDLINKIYPKPQSVFRENVKTYPNPVSNFLAIEFISNGNETIEINLKDVNARFLKSEKRVATKGFNNFEMEVISFPKGVYFLEIIGKNGKSVEKILKQ